MQSNGIDIYASFIVRPEFTKEDFKSFKNYCRSLALSFPTFSVLTPLPGTDFYEKVKEKLITKNYDLFDFFHTLLPTELPLDEFYDNLNFLYMNAKSPMKSLSFMMKYPLKEIPKLIPLMMRFSRQVKNAYKDY